MTIAEQNDQTQFAFEEPIFVDSNVEIPVDEALISEEPKKNKSKKMLLIGGVIFIVLLFFVVILFALRKQTVEVEEIPEESPVEVTTESSPFKVRIDTIRAELELADPAKQDLTFPPVNMTLRLDKKER